MKIVNKHNRPLTIAATGQTVEPGAEVDVDAKLGKSLLEQPARWGEPSKKSPPKKADKADKLTDSEEE